MKKTKAEVGYTLPHDCCATCKESYQNTYGDYSCNLLNELIDAGGLCREYKTVLSRPTVVTEEAPIVIEEAPVVVEENNCINCTHSWVQDNQPMCKVDDTFIENVYGICNAWEETYGSS
jgi:hypothetical protein